MQHLEEFVSVMLKDDKCIFVKQKKNILKNKKYSMIFFKLGPKFRKCHPIRMLSIL